MAPSIRDTIIIDDLVSEMTQDRYHQLVTTHDRWFFVKDMSYSNGIARNPSFGFNMLFKHPMGGVMSELYEAVCVPIVNEIINQTKIEIKDIHAARAFLQVPLENKFVKPNNGIHLDIAEPHYACVYYMNDSDGDTILYDQTIYDTPYGSQNVKVTEYKRVTPKKGRVVIFDGARYHCSTQPRNNYRCIINFVLTI